MKRFTKFFSLVCIAALAVSCYDDTKVWEKLNSLEKQLTELTSQVSAISTIVDAVEAGDYIKSVKPLADGGYEIDFAKADNLVIRDGKDGADAEAPVIGALKDFDGIYYWTLDEEWLVDSEGNKVPAGVNQPKLKADDGQWYISADGAKWDLIGPNVPCTISEVIPSEDAVTFKLAGGQEFVIPVVKALDITFDVEDGAAINGNTVIGYKIVGGTENNRVAVISSSADAVVTPVDAKSGSIALTADELGNCEIVVFVTDGVSSTIFKTLKFEIGVLKVEDNVIELGCDAATFDIPVVTSLDYNVTVDADWVSESAATKSIEIREEVITLEVTANPEMNSRTATVTLAPKDEAYADWAISVAVVQDGHATKTWSKEVRFYEDYDATKPVKLAKYGDNILLANTTKVYVLDPATGEAVNTINMPEGVTAHSVLVDDAGNFMIAADAPYTYEGQETPGVEIVLYLIPDPLNPVPEVLLTYNTGNYYCVETGNFRVKGNVKDDAVITATVADGGSGAAILWEIVDGKFTEYTFDWGARNWTYIVGPYSGWAVSTTCCAPAGTSLADGFFFVGYSGDYNLKYKVGEADWVTSYVTGSSWMENYNCISTATWKDNKYAAFVMGCHFAYDMADAVLVDVNDPSAAKHVYTHYGDGDAAWDWGAGVNNSWTGGGTYSDILLAASEDSMLMVYVDSQYGTIGCITIK